MLSVELFGSFLAAGILEVLIPVALGVFIWRGYGAGWRTYLIGAVMFLVSLARIPLNQVANTALAPTYGTSLEFLLFAFPALTAGVFEEGARYIAFRFLVKGRGLKDGLMYGAGHGGVESIALVGLSVLSTAFVLQYQPETLPPQALAYLASLPVYMPLIGLYERIWTMAVQVALSLIVLEGFRRGSWKYLAAAVLLHFLIDFSVVMLARQNIYVAEGAVTIWGVVAVYYVLRVLKETPSEGNAQAAAEADSPTPPSSAS